MSPRDFEQVVDAHYADLYRFAFGLSRTADDACDLTQQTFAIFAQKGDDIRDPARRKSWLFTTLYREFLRHNARSARVVSMEESDLEGLAQAAPSGIEYAADQAGLLEALTSLEDSQRAVVTLFYLDGHSYKDIAAILDLPIGTVMSRLSRAKLALREKLCGQPPAGGINPAPQRSNR